MPEGGEFYCIRNVNPEPWEPPEGALVRRGGKLTVGFYPHPKMVAYKEALRYEFSKHHPNPVCYDEPVDLTIWFWRELEGHANVADATNLQKATEDALQGLLFTNDRHVQSATSHIVAQAADVAPQLFVHVRAAGFGYGDVTEFAASVAPAEEEQVSNIRQDFGVKDIF